MDDVPADFTDRVQVGCVSSADVRSNFEQPVRHPQGDHALLQALIDQIPEGITIA